MSWDVVLKMVNAVGISNGQCLDDAIFEALYNEKVNYIANQMEGGNWRDREVEKDKYVPPHYLPKSKKPARSEGNRTEEMITRIFNKVEGSDKVLKDLKNDFSTMTLKVTYNFVSIKQLETQTCQISTYLNPRQKGTMPSDTVPNPKYDGC
ncbi:hypothetical protein MTR67_012707 [Solanum verrucosum]|uniref:Uncharacterized protein n=1 Tax=Solanum verrucosum TaxID=315347 RepID=A0AAF0QAB3_SOLVR|nr:hypothetical protein MTR67_012707 [Solanum verrucosum]